MFRNRNREGQPQNNTYDSLFLIFQVDTPFLQRKKIEFN